MDAIVYTSNTGHTEAYAKMLAEKTGLPAFSSDCAKKRLKKGSDIIYFGWICGSRIKGYKKAYKRYNIAAACAVGLCDTGALLDDVRKANDIDSSMPLFTLQGGIDRARLHGINKLIINMLEKGLKAQDDNSAEEARMLELLSTDKNYVCDENTAAFMAWFNSVKNT